MQRFILVSAINEYVLISQFALLAGTPKGFSRSEVALNALALTTEIKKYKSVLKENRKKRKSIDLFGKN